MHERNIDRLPLTTNQAHNPGTCPDQESNQQLLNLQDDTQPTEPLQSGIFRSFFIYVNNVVFRDKFCISFAKFILVYFILLDGIVNKIVSFSLFSDCLLQRYRDTINFWLLILFPTNVLNSFISCESF